MALLTLNRPETLNSLSIQLMAETREAIQYAAEDQEIRVLVITGTGKGFSAGADLAGGRSNDKNGKNINLSVGNPELIRAGINAVGPGRDSIFISCSIPLLTSR